MMASCFTDKFSYQDMCVNDCEHCRFWTVTIDLFSLVFDIQYLIYQDKWNNLKSLLNVYVSQAQITRVNQLFTKLLWFDRWCIGDMMYRLMSSQHTWQQLRMRFFNVVLRGDSKTMIELQEEIDSLNFGSKWMCIIETTILRLSTRAVRRRS